MEQLLQRPEFYRIISLALLGTCCGLIWDMFRALGREFAWRGYKRSLADIGFWCLISSLFIRYFLAYPQFGWRFYDLATTAMGGILYFAWFSARIVPVFQKLAHAARQLLHLMGRFLRIAFGIVSLPLVWISRIGYRFLSALLAMLFPPAPPADDASDDDEENTNADGR